MNMKYTVESIKLEKGFANITTFANGGRGLYKDLGITGGSIEVNIKDKTPNNISIDTTHNIGFNEFDNEVKKAAEDLIKLIENKLNAEKE